jgi:hypothetical protein
MAKSVSSEVYQRIKQLVIVLVAVSVTTSLCAEDRMRPGLWEVTTTSDGNASGTTGSTCYTPAMVQVGNTPAANLRQEIEKSLAIRHCTLKELTLEGHKVSMSMVCGPRSSTTSTTYSGDSFETTGTSTSQDGTSRMHMKGRRIGDCKE